MYNKILIYWPILTTRGVEEVKIRDNAYYIHLPRHPSKRTNLSHWFKIETGELRGQAAAAASAVGYRLSVYTYCTYKI